MKATEILRRYAAGERNFQRVNLRGQSFQGQDLSGADFSECDIRGTNFTNAILRGTNFTGAKAGLQTYQAVFILGIASFLILTLELLGGFIGFLATVFLRIESIKPYFITGLCFCIILAILFVIVVQQGYAKAREAWKIEYSVFLIVSTSSILSVLGAIFSLTAILFTLFELYNLALLSAVFVASFLIISLCLAVGVAGFPAMYFLSILFTVLSLPAFLGAMARFLMINGQFNIRLTILIGMVLLIVITLLSILGSLRLIKANQFSYVRLIVVNFTCLGGTSFRKADLTKANFKRAVLKGSDFRGAILTHTCFRDSQDLHRSRQENPNYSVLSNTHLRKLLITGDGYKRDYSKADLRGVNLDGANLEGANLKQADLSGATLKGANLYKANLTEVNAINTNFTDAYLTGACLEAWNIDRTTILDNVDCQYVFLLEDFNQHGSRERRPSSGDFQPGDFTKLFEEVIDTIDFIFRNGIDWKAFLIAFQQVQVENEDTPLTIQSIEDKGDGVFVVKVSVPPDTDKEKIHQEFTQNYDLALKAIEDKYKAQLEAKEENIILYKQSLQDSRQRESEMMTIINTLANKSGNRVELITGTKIDQSQTITTGQDLSINATDSLVNLRDINP